MASASVDITILFADICDSVRLFESLGDQDAHRLAARSLHIMSSIVATSEGRVWRTLGDGILCTFPSPDPAFAAASAIQDAHSTGPVSIKIGFSHGPLIEDSGELFGDAANLAARITALARGGEILMSEEANRGLSDFHRSATEMLISTPVKGKRKPVRIYRAIQNEDLQATSQVRIQPSQGSDVQIRTLVITRIDQTEIRMTPESDHIVIGRASGCGIFADSPFASRQHATIEPRGDRYLLTDTSTNGTFVLVNDQELSALKRDSMHLRGHGVIALGEEPGRHPHREIRFRIEQFPPPSPS